MLMLTVKFALLHGLLVLKPCSPAMDPIKPVNTGRMSMLTNEQGERDI